MPTKLEKQVDIIMNQVAFGHQDPMVVIFIPSHDKHQKALDAGLQARWTKKTMELLAKLFTGATSYRSQAGVWQASNGKILKDEPDVLEALVKKERLKDRRIIRKLVAFLYDLKKETKQDAVGLIVDQVFHAL